MPFGVDLPPLCIYTFVALVGRWASAWLLAPASECLPEDTKTLNVSVV